MRFMLKLSLKVETELDSDQCTCFQGHTVVSDLSHGTVICFSQYAAGFDKTYWSYWSQQQKVQNDWGVVLAILLSLRTLWLTMNPNMGKRYTSTFKISLPLSSSVDHHDQHMSTISGNVTTDFTGLKGVLGTTEYMRSYVKQVI